MILAGILDQIANGMANGRGAPPADPLDSVRGGLLAQLLGRINDAGAADIAVKSQDGDPLRPMVDGFAMPTAAASTAPVEPDRGGWLSSLFGKGGAPGAPPMPAQPMQLSQAPAQGPAATDQAPLAPAVNAAPVRWTDQAPQAPAAPAMPAMPVKDIAPRGEFGQAYAAPAAALAETGGTQTGAQSAPAATPAAAPKPFEVSIGERIRAFGRALQGQDPGNPAQAVEQKNQTMAFLISRGAKPEEARALVSNPTLLAQVLPGLVGSKQRAFGVIGETGDGQKAYGFIDTTNGQVQPYTGAGSPAAAGATPDAPGTPAPPPGVNPIEWRKTLAKKMAENAAEARANLPSVVAKSRQILDTLKGIEEDPSLPSVTGAIQGRIAPYFEATEGISRVMSKVEQLKGQAFLQAFETLKGGGQITNVEGDKATAAMTRLQNLRQGDKDYLGAIKELREIVQRVAIRTQRHAMGLPPLPEDVEAMKEIEARVMGAGGAPAAPGAAGSAPGGAPPKDAAISEARAAISRGADPDAVRKRLSQWGYTLD